MLLVLTALCGSWKAAGGSPDWATLSVVAGAGTLAAAGANTINQGIDADIDAVMRRTRSRPVPSKEIGPRVAIGIGSLFVSLAVGTMWLAANPLAGQLTLAAAVVYVFVYSLMMKRKSWNNIVIGGAAGAFPPLIGSAAVSGSIDAPGLYMFVLVFFWTPPHFWALSILLKEDYSAAKVPMLASVAGTKATVRQIMLYVLLLLGMAWLPMASGYGGLFFGLVGTFMALYWFWLCRPLLSEEVAYRDTLRAYKFSLLYLAVVFLAFAFEPALPWYV